MKDRYPHLQKLPPSLADFVCTVLYPFTDVRSRIQKNFMRLLRLYKP